MASIQYVTDASGRKKSVLLSVSQYQKLMKELEDLRDALDLDRAEEESEGLVSYDEARKTLQKEGRFR